jgi:type VI secretion system VgrG family protein
MSILATDQNKDLRFKFVSRMPQAPAFNVVSFTGTEAISKTYRFEIILISDDPDIDFSGMLNNPATLTVMSTDQATEVPYHGILAEFEQLSKVKDFYLYRAVLVPKIWRTSLSRVNEVYLSEQSVPDLVQDLLKKRQLVPNTDFEMALAPALASPYTTRSFYCQFNETDFNFIARRLEHHGIYYFFKHDQPSGELLYMTDATLMHPAEVLELQYSAPEDVMTSNQDKCVIAFVGRQQPVPKEVIVQDFWQGDAKLDKDLKATETVSASGEGTVMFYGCNVRTTSEASHIAKMRAQEILCRSKTYFGESPAVGVRSGYFIKLKDHYRSSVNTKYLVTEVTHSGSQAEIVLAGQNTPYNNGQSGATYQCSFSAIEESVQFRAECVTPMPTISGTMSGIVEGSGSTPELNTIGEYKVKLLYDHSFKPMGGGAIWVRMASPFPGSKNGLFFGLRPGAEVLLSFAGGDPDQPVIISSAPNSENPSVVNSSNATTSGIKDPNGNKLVMDSTPGGGGVGLYTKGKYSESSNVVPFMPTNISGNLGFNFKFDAGTNMAAGVSSNQSILASIKSDVVAGVVTENILGPKSSFIFGGKMEYTNGSNVKYEFAAASGKGVAGDLRNRDSFLVVTGFGPDSERTYGELEVMNRKTVDLAKWLSLSAVVLAQGYNAYKLIRNVDKNGYKASFNPDVGDLVAAIVPGLMVAGTTFGTYFKFVKNKKDKDFTRSMQPNSVIYMNKSTGIFMGARSERLAVGAAAQNAVVQAAVQAVGGQPAPKYVPTNEGSSRIRQTSEIVLIGVSNVARNWETDGEGKVFTDFVMGAGNVQDRDMTQVEYTPEGITQRTPDFENLSTNVTFETAEKWESLLAHPNGAISTIQQTVDNITVSTGPDTYLSSDRRTGLLLRHNPSAAPAGAALAPGALPNGPAPREPNPNLRNQVPGAPTDQDSLIALLSEEITLKKGRTTLIKLEANQIRLTVAGQGITISNGSVSIGSELEVRGTNISNSVTTLSNKLNKSITTYKNLIADTEVKLKERIKRSEKALKDLKELGQHGSNKK